MRWGACVSPNIFMTTATIFFLSMCLFTFNRTISNLWFFYFHRIATLFLAPSSVAPSVSESSVCVRYTDAYFLGAPACIFRHLFPSRYYLPESASRYQCSVWYHFSVVDRACWVFHRLGVFCVCSPISVSWAHVPLQFLVLLSLSQCRCLIVDHRQLSFLVSSPP